MEKQTEFLTVKEMAGRLKVPTSWLYQRTKERGQESIPRVKVGKYLRFNPDEVMKWIRKTYSCQS